jgi:Ca2+-binding RTX toxin-like protein
VVNVIPPDLNGVAPTCTIDTTGIDIDPATPGLQVQEGTTLSLRTTIRDDVLVNRVEVLVNGVVTSADPTYPYDLRAVLPSIANAGGTTATVRVRVTDSGGNVGLSDPLALTLTPDGVAPTIVDRNVVEGDLVGRSFRTFRFTFSEPVQLAAAADEVFRLVPPPGFMAPPLATRVVFRDNGRVIQLSADLLASGIGYRLEFDASKVRDRAGNLLGSTVEITHFDVTSAYDNMFFGTSGFDTLYGGEGRDFLSGAPRMNPETDTGSDALYGFGGNDDLYGYGNNDWLVGGDGDDLINGGLGNDFLVGEDGRDIFRYHNANEGGDFIIDFNGFYDRVQVSAAGFGGGLVAGMNLLASGRYVANSTGFATSPAGIGQFIYVAGSKQLYWDGDGAGGLSASPLCTFFLDPVIWLVNCLQVV